MRNPFLIKCTSGLINILTCLAAVIIILIRQDFFGKGDIYAFLFWTIPLAVALSVSGQTIIHLYGTKSFIYRLLFILLIAGVISIGWVYFVYLVLGPWIYTFSFPVFYLWVIGNAAQLLFLAWRLPKESVRLKVSKLIFQLFLFPLTLVLSVGLIYSASYLKEYVDRPEKEIYLIPENFAGKFRVVYGEKCGELPGYENGRRIMKIPDNRILIIQPEFKAGWANNEYYLVDENGKRTKLNELFNTHNRLTKYPGIIMDGSGSLLGEMPDGSSSTESPLAIHYTDFTVYNRDTVSTSDLSYIYMEQEIDSMTTILVGNCRQAKQQKGPRIRDPDTRSYHGNPMNIHNLLVISGYFYTFMNAGPLLPWEFSGE